MFSLVAEQSNQKLECSHRFLEIVHMLGIAIKVKYLRELEFVFKLTV